MAIQSKHSIFNKDISDFIGNVFKKYKPKFNENPRATTDKVQFIANNNPPLKEGTYSLEIGQSTSEQTENLYKASQDFHINGPRFGIKSEQFLSVFPPAGSIGDHAHILPHIALKRTTIPWEVKRKPLPWIGETDKDVKKGDPWLALIVFSDDEAPEIKQETLEALSLSDLFNHKNEVVDTIEVPTTLIKKILPKTTVSSLKYLANLRQRTKKKLVETKKDGTKIYETEVLSERAFVEGGRLPKANSSHTVHLVSLADFPAPSDSDKTKLISLYNWKFTCLEDKPSFRGLMENLDARAFRLYNPEKEGVRTIQNRYISKGFVPMPHTMRKGLQSLSWYRGPLLPSTDKIKSPGFATEALSADDYLRKDDHSQMLETSYAVAWQLGRMLTLKSKDVALDIQSFKRKIAQQVKSHKIKTNKNTPSNHLSFLQKNTLTKHQEAVGKSLQTGDLKDVDVKPSVGKWLDQLMTLEVVPFVNLVPNPKMLPLNSIRFFTLDPHWITSLLEGALSLGDEKVQLPHSDFLFGNSFSGFLLRSEVVGDYPDLHIAGYTKIAKELDDIEPSFHPIVTRKLSKEVMLCIFDVKIQTIDFSLHKEALHMGFGFDQKKNQLTKHARYLQGPKAGEEIDPKGDGLPFSSFDPTSGIVKSTGSGKTIVDTNRVLNITNLKSAFNAFFKKKQEKGIVNNPGDFSLQMTEGVPKVRLVVN